MATQVKLYQRLKTQGFPIISVQYSRNGMPLKDQRATTYYLRYRLNGKRHCSAAGNDVLEAENQRKRMESRLFLVDTPAVQPMPGQTAKSERKALADEAAIYIERSKQKSRKTYLGYKLAVELFVLLCKKTYLGEITRDDMLDFKQGLIASGKSLSTVFNTFLKVIVFLNDRGIGKYVEDDWLKAKDWPVNVDKKNQNKKYTVYTEEEVAALLAVATKEEEALIRFCVGSGFRIGEVAVTQWKDVDWGEKTACIKTKPHLEFHPKDYEERVVALPDSVIDMLNEIRGDASEDDLVFPSRKGGVDKHLADRVINGIIDKANAAGNVVQKPKKPAHAFRVLYATRLHQQGVDIETIRQDLGHSDITTTQIYLRSANKQSDAHRKRINAAANFKAERMGMAAA